PSLLLIIVPEPDGYESGSASTHTTTNETARRTDPTGRFGSCVSAQRERSVIDEEARGERGILGARPLDRHRLPRVRGQIDRALRVGALVEVRERLLRRPVRRQGELVVRRG